MPVETYPPVAGVLISCVKAEPPRVSIKINVDFACANRRDVGQLATNVVVKIKCVEVVCCWGERRRHVEVTSVVSC
jgi:hypothetical protein